MERNLKTKYAEIDIVAKYKNTLVFVEVRTTGSYAHGTPEETLTQSKLWKVKQNAKGYIAHKKYVGPCRIDAVCVTLNKNNTTRVINHYENIVQ